MQITHVIPDHAGEVQWPDFGKETRTVIAIGNFDGVHLGHQAVLQRTHDLAVAHGAVSVAILFDPRPAVVFRYAASHGGQELAETENYPDPYALTTLDQRLKLIEQCGIDHAIVVRYNLAFGQLTYQYFLGALVGKLGMRTLVLGKDACIGKDRTGTVSAIDTVAQATRTFEVSVVDDRGPGIQRIPTTDDPGAHEAFAQLLLHPEDVTKAQRRAITKQYHNKTVRTWSSTFIRFALSCGAVNTAAAILGRPYSVEGTVIQGKQRGRDLGFPTANVSTQLSSVVPADGVYAGWLTDLDDPEQTQYAAAISIGTNPTFAHIDGQIERVIEAYALSEQWLELYHHRVRIAFAQYLNPMRAFDSVDELVAALKLYEQQTRRITAVYQVPASH